MEEGCQARDGCGCDFALGERLGVVGADEDGGVYVLHGDVFEGDVVDLVAAVAVGLDADALVGAFEVDALGVDIVRAAGDLAADGEAVAVHELAVGDGDVFAGLIGAGRVDDAALDGDVVVAYVGEDVIDDDVAGAEGIDGVGVGRVLRGQDADVADGDVVGVVGHDLPAGGVLDGDAFDADVLAVIEDDESRAEGDLADDSGVMRRAGDLPPAFAVAVDGACAGDGDVLRVGGADQRLRAGGAELGLLGIVSVVGGAEEGCIFGEVEGDVALQHDGAGEEGSAGEFDGAASGGAIVDGRLDGLGVLGGAVGLGAVGAGVADLTGGKCG